MKKTNSILAIAGLVLALAPATQAATITQDLVPSLNVDDTLHLVFVTSTTTTATSNDIADYNNFVQGVANATSGNTLDLSGYTWKAIASTQTGNVQANANVSVTADVYLVDGTQVSSAANFWTNSHLAAISINENGGSYEGNVWTGSNFEGWKNNNGLGTDGGTGDPKKSGFGDSTATNNLWGGEAGLLVQTTSLPLYAVSEELTVIAAVPEPATMSLLAIGGIAAIRRRRRA